jgi:hypothetical protein
MCDDPGGPNSNPMPLWLSTCCTVPQCPLFSSNYIVIIFQDLSNIIFCLGPSPKLDFFFVLSKQLLCSRIIGISHVSFMVMYSQLAGNMYQIWNIFDDVVLQWNHLVYVCVCRGECPGPHNRSAETKSLRMVIPDTQETEWEDYGLRPAQAKELASHLNQ